MIRTGVAAGLVLACAIAAPAEAASLVNSGGMLTYTADTSSGAPISLSIDNGYPSTTTVRVTRSYADSDPIAAAGCTSSDGKAYTCEGVNAVVVTGGSGDDSLDFSGLQVPVTASGGAGSDDLWTGAGADSLSGGPGDDSVAFAKGDTVSGGPGIDHANYLASDGDAAVAISLDGAANDGSAGEAINVLPDVEDVDAQTWFPVDFIGASAAAAPLASPPATLTGSAGANRLTGTVGNDTIDGAGGSDVLIGDNGDDTLLARDGIADRVVCGPGNDTAVVDQFDQVSETCENVQSAPASFGLEDRPPSVEWVSGVPLRVTASDDHGVARVQFVDGDRVVCTATAAPFTCAAQPAVGHHTLVAIATDTAGQTTSALRRLDVPRFKPTAVSLAVTRSGHRYTAHGKVSLPAGVPCSGTVAVRTGATTRAAALSRACTYRTVITTSRRRPPFTATYRGNATIESKRSKEVRARTSDVNSL